MLHSASIGSMGIVRWKFSPHVDVVYIIIYIYIIKLYSYILYYITLYYIIYYIILYYILYYITLHYIILYYILLYIYILISIFRLAKPSSQHVTLWLILFWANYYISKAWKQQKIHRTKDTWKDPPYWPTLRRPVNVRHKPATTTVTCDHLLQCLQIVQQGLL